ncbi:NAD(P)-binding Rossmann-fold superfamily protein [Striga asiatica]|uniref:NAD(P)-binding Rossmann-fold superfamily protein n=1 Tax=Striga asiatica TaxID=4170 RepID=A0A5A7Q6Y7_STRAF|nr:NAD(P)-binding Rossmann-fold superfamily protein [Striga asiatica]
MSCLDSIKALTFISSSPVYAVKSHSFPSLAARNSLVPAKNLKTFPRFAVMELKASQAPPPTRYAVVTGANKGIGFETVRQLATAGVIVVLTARNQERGSEAAKQLQESGLSNVIFHQLDVRDAQSIQALAKFVAQRFERLDILVNNAGASGVEVDENALKALDIDAATWLAGKAVNLIQDAIKTTYEKAKECIDTNYYGVKNVTEALIPSLQKSTSGARIVNVSSLRSELNRVPNEDRRKELGDIDTLTEEKIDRILQQFLHDLQHGALEANGWQKMLPAYSISKATLNAYTRVLAKRYPEMCINCVHPGFVKTDINWQTGTMTVQEGAEGPVMLALLPEGGPTGCYFDCTRLADF